MPKKAKDEPVQIDPLEMICRLLAMHLIKGLTTDEAALQLGSVGFDNRSVSAMVGISESAVRGLRFRHSKGKKQKSKAR